MCSAIATASSGLHGLDARVKLLGLVLSIFVSMVAGYLLLAVISILLIALVVDSNLPLFRLARALKYFFYLLALIFLARALSTPGQVLWQGSLFSITQEGLQAGTLMCWRLTLVIVMGLLLVNSTRISRITGAVRWYLRPIPGINETRIALMMGLVVRFIPDLLQRTADIAAAPTSPVCGKSQKSGLPATGHGDTPFAEYIFGSG